MRFEKDAEVDGLERRIGGETEGQAARQEEAVAGAEEHGVGNGFYREPALAGEDRVTLDAFVLWKLDGEIAIQPEGSRDVALGLQQRQDFR
jgi:hypothetical protein